MQANGMMYGWHYLCKPFNFSVQVCQTDIEAQPDSVNKPFRKKRDDWKGVFIHGALNVNHTKPAVETDITPSGAKNQKRILSLHCL